MNVYDSQRMIDLLSPLGYEITETPNDADMAILNTCHIREKAEQKVFSDLGRLRIVKDERAKSGNDMMIAVGGCVAQAEGAEIIKQAPYVSMVFGPQAYHKLPEMIARTTRERDIKKGKKKRILALLIQIFRWKVSLIFYRSQQPLRFHPLFRFRKAVIIFARSAWYHTHVALNIRDLF